MEQKQRPAQEERLQGVISLLNAGDIKCDKCGKTIRYRERYCYNTHECPVCGAAFDTAAELDRHFGQEGHPESSRGTRYCTECSLKSGFVKMVRNKKSGQISPSMFVLRDEEEELVK